MQARPNSYLRVLKARARTDWAYLRRTAAAGEPKIRAAFLRAVAALQGGVRLDALRAALGRGDLDAAAAAVPWDLLRRSLRDDLVREVVDVYERSGQAAARALPMREAGFTITDARPLEWIRDHGADLVVQVTEDTRAGLRALVARAHEQGLPATTTASLIHRGGLGLFDRWAEAVVNRARKYEEQGFSPARVAQETARYANELRMSRALMIARTESALAHTAGQREAWEQAADDGLMDRDTSVRVWIASPNACEICLSLDGQVAGLDEPFRSAQGGQYDGPGEPHPNCTCVTMIRPNAKGGGG